LLVLAGNLKVGTDGVVSFLANSTQISLKKHLF